MTRKEYDMNTHGFDSVAVFPLRQAEPSAPKGAGEELARSYRAPQLFVAGTAVRLLRGWYSGVYDGRRYGLVRI
jgi:hypothetical protein